MHCPAITIARSAGRPVAAHDLLQIVIPQFVGSAQLTVDDLGGGLLSGVLDGLLLVRAQLACTGSCARVEPVPVERTPLVGPVKLP
jgi:hypothetical protein